MWTDPFSDDDPEENSPAGPPDDPRFDWVEVANFAGDRTWIKGKCHHLTPAPVDLRTGQLVAWWCPDCGEQFDWDRWPCPPHLWVPLPEVVRPANGFERWVYGNASPVTPVNPYVGPCPHRQRDWRRCAVCTAPDTPKPGPYGFDPLPRRDPDDPDYVIIWEAPDDDLVPWIRWAGGILLRAWNGVKSAANTKIGYTLIIAAMFALMYVTDHLGGFD